MDIRTLTKEQLQNEILFNDDGLYEQFDEARLLNGEYTREEMLEIFGNWIQQNDECGVLQEETAQVKF